MKDYNAAKNVIMSLSGELFKNNTLFFNLVEDTPKSDNVVLKNLIN